RDGVRRRAARLAQWPRDRRVRGCVRREPSAAPHRPPEPVRGQRRRRPGPAGAARPRRAPRGRVSLYRPAPRPPEAGGGQEGVRTRGRLLISRLHRGGRMRMTTIAAIPLALAAGLLPGRIGAEPAAARVADKQVEETMKQIGDGLDNFVDKMDPQLRRSVIKNERGEGDLKAFLDDLRKSSDALKGRLQPP